ncbi:MAG: putative permease DMT [Planctomycetota bacterium]|nr:MAG: putative permease DMT [Planctomycetota bacterium]
MDGIGDQETSGSRRRERAVWGLVFCTLFWGATFFLMKSGSDEIAKKLPAADRAWAPLLFLAARFALASLAFPFVFPRLRHGARDSIRWGVLAGVPFTIGFILQIYGLRDVSPAISALFTSMFVVFTPLLGRILFGKRTSAAVALAIGCAVVGLWLVTGAEKSGVPHFGRGEWLSLLCALVFSFQIHATDIGTKRCDPIGLAWHQITFAAIACALPILLLRPSAFAGLLAALPQRDVWLGIGFTAILATVGSMALMSHFQRFLSPNHAAVIYTLEPLFAGIFSAIFFAEGFGAAKLVGGGLILAGNLACGVRGSPSEAAKEPGQG